MGLITGVVRDEDNGIVAGASVYVYVVDTTTPVTLYSDRAMTVTRPNPIVTGSAGEYLCYAPDGSYDIKITAAGHPDVTIPDVPVVDPSLYAVLSGRPGGTTQRGGTAAGEILELRGTANATPGTVRIEDSALVFNEAGADRDARFEGDTEPNLFFLDASTDRVGFGTNLPSARVDMRASLSGGSVARVQNTHGSGYSGIEFHNEGGTVSSFVGGDNINDYFRINSGAQPLVLLTSNIIRLNVDANGLISVPGMHNATGNTSTAETVTSGSYTPTLTAVANAGGLAAGVFYWFRMGKVIHVEGAFDCDPTAGSTLTKVGVSLPVASNFTLLGQLSGGGCTDDGSAMRPGRVVADVTNDRAELQFYASAAADSRVWSVWFTYPVL